MGRADVRLFLSRRSLLEGASGNAGKPSVWVHLLPMVRPFDAWVHSSHKVISGPSSLVDGHPDGNNNHRDSALTAGEAILFHTHLGQRYTPVLIKVLGTTNDAASAEAALRVEVTFPDIQEAAEAKPSLTCGESVTLTGLSRRRQLAQSSIGNVAAVAISPTADAGPRHLAVASACSEESGMRVAGSTFESINGIFIPDGTKKHNNRMQYIRRKQKKSDSDYYL